MTTITEKKRIVNIGTLRDLFSQIKALRIELERDVKSLNVGVDCFQVKKAVRIAEKSISQDCQ